MYSTTFRSCARPNPFGCISSLYEDSRPLPNSDDTSPLPRASVPLRATRNRANERDRGEYRTAIVDEAQDMSLVGMQLVRALIAGNPGNDVPPDGLLILDDAAQRIYAGGFRLRWAGIQVTGRSEILRTNYRNTKPVVEAAKAVRGDTLPVREDNDNGAAAPSRYEQEEGPAPAFPRIGKHGEVRAIAGKIAELVREHGFAHETIGVLTRGNNDSNNIKKWLEQRWNIACVPLRDMRGDGPLGNGVRVGTFDRSAPTRPRPSVRGHDPCKGKALSHCG